MFQLWKLVHLIGVVGFMAAHGTSMAAGLLMKRIASPRRIAGVLQLSGATVGAFYGFTLLLLIGGIGAGFAGRFWGQGWIWTSLALLIGTGVLMFPLASRYFRRIRLVLELMDSGTEVSQDDFDRILASGQPLLATGTGAVAILLITYLMVMKPF
jgi:uncharacterized membrane protein